MVRTRNTKNTAAAAAADEQEKSPPPPPPETADGDGEFNNCLINFELL
jgi:hypothetical protein